MAAMKDNNAGTRNTSRRSSGASAVVPPVSREATARKIEPVYPTDTVETAIEEQREQILNEIAVFEERRDRLVDRLDDGAALIEKNRAEGKAVANWEDYWINLLRQYETICERLRELRARL